MNQIRHCDWPPKLTRRSCLNCSGLSVMPSKTSSWSINTQKEKEKERGQYLAILTEQAWSLEVFHLNLSLRRHFINIILFSIKFSLLQSWCVCCVLVTVCLCFCLKKNGNVEYFKGP